jgi:HEAT repeat protein
MLQMRNMIGYNEQEDAYFDKVMKSALNHDRREKRREMVYILGELRDPRALFALKTIMTEDDPYLVSEAVKAAGKIGGSKAMDLLKMMIHHRSFMVRGEVALAIGELDHPMKEKLLGKMVTDPSPYVANCARLVLNYSNISSNLKNEQRRTFCYAKRCDKSW